MVRLLGLASLIMAAATSAFAADDPYPSRLSYAVVRAGQKIGQHTVTFQRQGPIKVVSIASDIEVRALGVTAYRYTYRGREEWNGETLQALHATTEDNGKHFAVNAERRGGALVVEGTAPALKATAALADQGFRGPDVSRQSLPGTMLPTNGWDFRLTRQTALLNTQDGKVAHVQVTPAGRETVQTAGGSVPATRYRYTGDLRMDQWFDDKGRWVKGAFTAFDGSTIEYILQE